MKEFRIQTVAFTRVLIAGLVLLSLALLTPGCLSGGYGRSYYGRVNVPREQEFRWSDGGLPQVFDPAFAAAPPDTDAVRALFEGLTDYDPRTLKPTPGVAERWESADDGRVWTFYLREDARWSNGESVTARDFVRSWERTLRLGDLAPHTELLSNIVGARSYVVGIKARTPRANPAPRSEVIHQAEPALLGAVEVGPRVLRVVLQRPNSNFPALVAHPVFRPVKLTDKADDSRVSSTNMVSNGAFRLTKSESDKVLLQRADTYWNKGEVSLERVEFVNALDTETALAAYQAGDVDAVTNTLFEPLALKLLAPYGDYRRNTYAALTYYSFNTAREPFNDVRVREALAIAIDRERISENEMGGATEPANTFLPINNATEGNHAVVAKSATLNKDQSRARTLLADAGFPEGQGFPVVRLLINRNEQQRQVAQAVASSWRSILKIETEIIAKPWDEYEASIRAGDYDLVRRGVVMQSADESSNIKRLFPLERGNDSLTSQLTQPGSIPPADPGNAPHDKTPIETEAEALRQVTAIPIYFASSYSLIKPYVNGFDSNILDAPSLKHVKIDTGWELPKTANK